MEEFVDQTKTLVGALGWDLFREMRGRLTEPTAQMHPSPVDPSPVFFFRGEGLSAEMTIAQSGDFVVKAGSKARARITPTIPKGTLALRDTLQKSGVLQEDAGSLVFASDYSFPSASASAAAATVIGASANGRILWKLNDGRCYADWEAGGALSFVAVSEKKRRAVRRQSQYRANGTQNGDCSEATEYCLKSYDCDFEPRGGGQVDGSGECRPRETASGPQSA